MLNQLLLWLVVIVLLLKQSGARLTFLGRALEASRGRLEDDGRGRSVRPIGTSRAGLLRLRGGAAAGDSKKDEKIKGICIGIDLGTTYR
jgi:hypothetical protein